MSKKGSRKITVNGTNYRWRVSRYRIISEWRNEDASLSNEYSKAAAKYGLGDVADIVFNIPIQLYNNPKSTMIITYFGRCVDGFLGIEKFTQVTPKMIATMIENGISNGWDPHGQKSYAANTYENDEIKSPPILVLPGFMNDDVTDYENIMKPTKLL